jgi:serine protease Do
MQTSHKINKLIAAVTLATAGLGLATVTPALSATTPAEVAMQPATPDFTTLVERNSAAVVNITVTGKNKVAQPMQMPELDEDSPFYEFFKRFGMPHGPGRQFNPPTHGMGSGFIISSDGYIVTNHHVVDGADKITVRLDDKREFEAKRVGSDPQSDIALLKIEADGLPTVTLGDSDRLKVGQWVVAIGAPFGLDRTATKGIVSALGRSLPNDTYVPFIQTDVPINPGNSGGPLFDLEGRVVGINSQIFSRSGGYMGLSFAIPVNVALNVVEQLKTAGQVTRGWLGITLQEVTHDLAKSFGLEQPRGALVSAVTDDSPAGKAGFKAGDVITAYGDRKINDSADLPPLVGATKPGTEQRVTVVRDGKERSLEVRIGQLPSGQNSQLASGESRVEETARLNISVSDLNPATRKATGTETGVLVEDVNPGLAAEAGVQPGDILLSIDRQPIKNVAHLRELVSKLPTDKPVPLLVKRNDGTLYLALRIPGSGQG